MRTAVSNSPTKGLPRRAPPVVSQGHPDEELGRRHRGDGHVVVVSHEVIEGLVAPFGADEDRGVEDQAGQLGCPLRVRTMTAQHLPEDPPGRLGSRGDEGDRLAPSGHHERLVAVLDGVE